MEEFRNNQVVGGNQPEVVADEGIYENLEFNHNQRRNVTSLLHDYFLDAARDLNVFLHQAQEPMVGYVSIY